MKCPFCNSDNLRITQPVDKQPAYRCFKCNVRMVITNPSYLPPNVKKSYWITVANEIIGKVNNV